MSLNGRDIEEWGLTPLEGTLQTLMKPAPTKALPSNENASLHGSQMITTPSSRRYQKQEFSLMFYIDARTIPDLHRRIKQLTTDLTNGKKLSGSYTGINELTIPELETTYRLVLAPQPIDKYDPYFLTGAAAISIKFIEPNPNNRAL